MNAMRSLLFALFVTLPAFGQIVPVDRTTSWNPGLAAVGGIPSRTGVCAIVSPQGGGLDDSANIQTAIDGNPAAVPPVAACPAGQVVQLSAGTFTVNNYILIDREITLRGAGDGQTILHKTNGAVLNQETTLDRQPIVIVGPSRWPAQSPDVSSNLTADGVKGAFSVTVMDGTLFSVGQIVTLDELSGASWQVDPQGRGQVCASSDFKVVWQLHNPGLIQDDPLSCTSPVSGAAASWFSRQDRPINEVKEVVGVAGNVISFNTPLHTNYRVSNTAQLTHVGPLDVHVLRAGIEKLSVTGGSDGAIRFENAAYSWMKSVGVSIWMGEGVAIDNSFRIEVRNSYVHDAAWAQPGGAGYAFSLSSGSSDVLVEDNVILMANKVMVARSAGAGSVFGYNYADDGYINTNGSWVEVGLNGSHMVGSHHMLFEGNYGFNYDADDTHGNVTYHTVYRNLLRGVRKPFVDPLDGRTYNDTTQAANGPLRCAGSQAYSYFHSFAGNVLGAPGQMAGWVYQSGDMTVSAIWLLGWDSFVPYPVDAQVAATTFRRANYDYLTNTLDGTPGAVMPNSLYLAAAPAFFGTNQWPWINSQGATDADRVKTLPAKARYDAGAPIAP